ncbi:membrane protein [Pyrococcus horikoshii]|uniref:Uncharacterized protein n=2 Tax=Pyrococcus horikoshii TaxID=53953 RepID=O57929_PYRHO|nr:membrane protein [Pyrococcus horikoshii]BAA29259.1 193aa long hypothetical protein [Pyrococcus horikoshii OT3]HII61467.1 hypothetical protein [Pyrococcus horikoshii]
MDVNEPIMAAFPIAKRLWNAIVNKKGLPDPEEVSRIIEEIGLRNLYKDEGIALFRNRYVVALLIPRKNMIVIDFISASGELSDALELVAYYDKEIECYVIEIIPANELEYEENLGIEPVIIDAKTFELKSYPVLGEFEVGRKVKLKIDSYTFKLWRESGKLNVCPVCGGELRWKKEKAVCLDCGIEVIISEER